MTSLNRRVYGLSFLPLILIAFTGCDKPKEGPKRPGYKEATIAHYNPDIPRRAMTTRPAATQPQDFQFGAVGVGSPVMMVNAEPITVPEVLEPMIEDLAIKAKTLSENAYRDYLTRRIIEQVGLEISRNIIYQEAKKTFPDKADEAFGKEADKIVQEIINGRYGGVKARYEAHLKGLDLSLPEIKERTKRQLMVSQFLRERFKPMIQNPSRNELWKYYRDHEADFTTTPKAELFLIEIPIEAELGKDRDQATAQELAAARERAVVQIRRAREELESGIAFADVARQYSKGLQAGRGGAVGEIGPGALTRHWAKAAETLFTLEEGQLAGPVETEESIFLIKCGRKTPQHKADFQESQEKIKDKLMDAQFDDMQRKYLMQLEAKSTVLRREDFMMAVFAAAPRPPRYEAASLREAKPSP